MAAKKCILFPNIALPNPLCYKNTPDCSLFKVRKLLQSQKTKKNTRGVPKPQADESIIRNGEPAEDGQASAGLQAG